MAKWTAFPHDAATTPTTPRALKKKWARLHAGDAEPLPKDDKVLAAWALFHAGEFQKASDAGLKAGGAGITVANKAQAIYANYLEKSEKTKLALFLEVAERAEAQAAPRPEERQRLLLAWPTRWAATARASAWPRRWRRAWAARSRPRWRPTIKLAPKHADAHIALGAFHAEVIDKVGALLGRTPGREQGHRPDDVQGRRSSSTRPRRSRWSSTPTAW